MDIFKEVKARASILKVCDVLGLKLNRSNMMLCPFHKEKTPSFSVSPEKNIFCCFGCGKKGDVITLVEEILNLSAFNAAKYINDHLGLGLMSSTLSSREINFNFAKYEKKKKAKEEFLQWENQAFQTLCNYYHLLQNWKRYNDVDNPRYVESLQQIDKIEYYIDFLINGTLEDKIWFRKNNRKVVENIERKLAK